MGVGVNEWVEVAAHPKCEEHGGCEHLLPGRCSAGHVGGGAGLKGRVWAVCE